MVGIVEHTLNTLRAKFESRFVQYYDGDPIGIPQSALPCIIVDLEKTEVRAGPTGMDKLIHSLAVIICLDKTADFGQFSETAVTSQKLRELVGGFSTGVSAHDASETFDTATLLGVLRTDLTLAGYITSQEADIDYGIQFRAPTDTITAQVRITLTCSQTVPVTRTYQPA